MAQRPWYFDRTHSDAEITYWMDHTTPHDDNDRSRALQLFPLLAHDIPELELDLPMDITSLEDCSSQFWAAMSGRLKCLSLSVSQPLPPNFTEATGKLGALQELTLGTSSGSTPPPKRGSVCLRLPKLSSLTMVSLALEAVELECPKLAQLHLFNITLGRLSGPGQALEALEVCNLHIPMRREEVSERELFLRFPMRSWHGLRDLCINFIDLSKRQPFFDRSDLSDGNLGSLGDLSSLTGVTSLDLRKFGDVLPSALPASLQRLSLDQGMARAMTRLNPACWRSLAGSLQVLLLGNFDSPPDRTGLAAGFWQDLTSLQEVEIYGITDPYDGDINESNPPDVYVTLPQLKELSLFSCFCLTVDIDCPSLVKVVMCDTKYERLSIAPPSLRSLRILDCLQRVNSWPSSMSRSESGSDSEAEADSDKLSEPPAMVVPFNFQLTNLQELQLLQVSLSADDSKWLSGEAVKDLQRLTNLRTLLLGSQRMTSRATPTALPTSLRRLELNLESTASHTGIPETVDGLSQLSALTLRMPIHQTVVLQRPLSPFLAMPGLRTLDFLPAERAQGRRRRPLRGRHIDWDDDALKLLKEASAAINMSGSELKLSCDCPDL